MPELSAPHRKLPTALIIRLAVGIAMLCFLFTRHANLSTVVQLIKNASSPWLIFALFLAISGEIITAYKWRRLVAIIGGNLPILKAIRASFIGMFYNNFFPGSVGGDIARVLLISREAGGKARATASAFMQRNTGLAGLFAVGIPAALLFPLKFEIRAGSPLQSLPAKSILTDSRFWLIAVAIAYAIVNIMIFSPAIYKIIWRLSDHEEATHARGRLHYWLRKILRKIQRFHSELHSYSFWLPYPLLISVFTQLIDVYMVWCFAQAIGTSVSVSVLMVAVSMITVASLAPVTVNGIGLREILYVALLHPAGVPVNAAVAISLLKFAVITILAALGGLAHIAGPEKDPTP